MRLISFFARRHFLVNVIFFGVIAAGILIWPSMGKEEMPDFEVNWIRITAPYPGSTADDIETLVTKPIERELKSVSGLQSIKSTSRSGQASISVEMDPNLPDFSELIQRIKEAVDQAVLPAETRERLRYRQFKTSEKAILDVAIFHQSKKLLDYAARKALQDFARTFENQITNLEEISRATMSGHLSPQLQIIIDHQKLRRLSVPLGQVISILEGAHYISPSGSLEDRSETKVSVISEYVTPVQLRDLIVRSNSDGNIVRLSEVATIKDGFVKQGAIQKVQGREAVIVNLRKSSSTDILEARAAAFEVIDSLKKRAEIHDIAVLPMDDESFSVRNRLGIVTSNGLLGFALIALTLFVFLDWRSGFWAASGIPFCLCFTVCLAYMLGYTVNNVTLAGIIIVLGIVVDDAIIVSENVARMRQNGASVFDAAVQGTYQLVKPISVAILTTCIAFVPLYFFGGRLGGFVKYIPVLIFCMLGASLLESIFILPAHLTMRRHAAAASHPHWFLRFEEIYRSALEVLLRWRFTVLGVFLVVLVGAGYLFVNKMQFVLFPSEEPKEVYFNVEAEEDLNRYEMARKVDEVEQIIMKSEGVHAVRTSVARSRRGGEVRENRAFVRVELVPKTERSRSVRQLKTDWQSAFAELTGYKDIKMIRHRFGQSSGSPIAVEIRDNDDTVRSQVAEMIRKSLSAIDGIDNVEIEEPLRKTTYEIVPRQREMMLSGIRSEVLTSNARAYLNGLSVYKFIRDDEEVEAVVSLEENAKRRISQLGDLLIENSQSYLIPLRRFAEIKKVEKPSMIERRNHKRTTMVYADIKKGAKISPLSIAQKIEAKEFLDLQETFPSALLRFTGEVEDTRNSSSEFLRSIIFILAIIYAILILMFNSFLSPLIIMLMMPFGAVGVILAFYGHGMEQYGFMAAVGALGMVGVVINDAIIMIAKLEDSMKGMTRTVAKVAEIASTRFRAVVITTLTTVAGLLPTAYGVIGFDSMLAEMMLAMAWGLVFGTTITLILTPALYAIIKRAA